MNKSQFINKVLKGKQGLANINTYFYVLPVTHILSGFFCEMTPRGAYIWRFLYPLFDTSDALHLLYSKRLEYPNDYIDFGSVDKADLANTFLYRIEAHIDDAHELLTIQKFRSYCESRPSLLEHEHSQMVYGFAMLLLNEDQKAFSFLNRARMHLQSPYKEQCLEVLQLLSKEPKVAKELILKWEESVKLKLGVQTT